MVTHTENKTGPLADSRIRSEEATPTRSRQVDPIIIRISPHINENDGRANGVAGGEVLNAYEMMAGSHSEV